LHNFKAHDPATVANTMTMEKTGTTGFDRVSDSSIEKSAGGPDVPFDRYTAHLPPDPDAHLSPEERHKIERALLWKLDRTLIPFLCLLYLTSFLDRTNIGNAKLDGLTTGAHVDPGGQYNAALSIFFVSYALAEPLTNVLLKRFRPSLFLPATMVAWGIVMTVMGLVSSFGGLMTCRFFLGLAEAGLFPGISYYLSCWYKREEFGVRLAIFFSAAALAGSFGGLLAAGINQMAGLGGKGGWAWIFILEGIATVLIALLSFFFVHGKLKPLHLFSVDLCIRTDVLTSRPDFPDEAKFLSDVDRARVIRRLAMDKQASAKHEDFDRRYITSALVDWKTYLYAAVYMGADMPLYAFSLFLPTIISQLGYKSTTAQLLTVPPYAAAAIATIAIGFVADRTKQRGICNMLSATLGAVGFAMLLSGSSAAVSYAGVFLAAMGIYPTIANTISWAANNVEGVYKRGVSLGIIIGWGNLCGIISSNIYRSVDAPRFLPGHGSVMAFLIIFLLAGSALMYVLLKSENKKRLSGARDHWTDGVDENEAKFLGDKRPDFLYTL